MHNSCRRQFLLAVAFSLGLAAWSDGLLQAATQDDQQTPPSGTPTPLLIIKWFGHACFLVQCGDGTKILIDPFDERLGLPLPVADPDVVLVTHPHFDHNNVEPFTREGVTIYHGLEGTPRGRFRPLGQLRHGVARISNLKSFHDQSKGSRRGENSIFIIEVGGLRLVHCGDLGQQLDAEQVASLGRVDVLMIPVGGTYTVDADGARGIVSALKPRITIPMHYKIDPSRNLPAVPIAPVDGFLEGLDRVRHISGPSFAITSSRLPDHPEVWVLDYRAPESPSPGPTVPEGQK